MHLGQWLKKKSAGHGDGMAATQAAVRTRPAWAVCHYDPLLRTD